MNYEQANEQLQGRNKLTRKLANNTYLIRHDDFIALRLHNTDVILFYPDGKIILTSGGWHTPTTKDRINSYSGYRVSQSNSRWSLFVNGKAYPFEDGITIHPNRTVTGYGKDNLKADNKIKTQVKAYAQLYANKLPLDKPSGGDCWYCSMVTDKKETLGDASKNIDHLKSHIKEKYVIPSLAYNAMVEAGYNPSRNIQFYEVFENPGDNPKYAQDTVKKCVYRYMLKRFGYAV